VKISSRIASYNESRFLILKCFDRYSKVILLSVQCYV